MRLDGGADAETAPAVEVSLFFTLIRDGAAGSPTRAARCREARASPVRAPQQDPTRRRALDRLAHALPSLLFAIAALQSAQVRADQLTCLITRHALEGRVGVDHGLIDTGGRLGNG